MASHRLVWKRQGSGHTWWGTPPGWLRVVEVLRRAETDLMGRPVRVWWQVRSYFGDDPDIRLPTAETAMRLADSLWDAHAARHRI